VLLSEKSDAVDHLLGSRAGSLETRGETGIFALEKLHSLRGNDTLHSGRLQALEPRLGLQRAPAKGSELVAKMLDELLQLTKRGSFRSYAV
jgi:hypothetical protein